MPFIQNVPKIAVVQGSHLDAGEGAVLIQITDICYEPPKPAFDFAERHHFEFMDVLYDSENAAEIGIRWEQAVEIVSILKKALEEGRNVVVHCHAGLCRSGAVAEVGIMMGFTETRSPRQPNSMVKHMLMKVNGWTYD